MKKAIIVYASAGAGHFKAAQAIYDYLKKERSDLDIAITDALQYCAVPLKFVYNFGYSFLVRYLPAVWRALFWITHFKPLRGLGRKLASAASSLNTAKFSAYLVKEGPDYIISTHFMTSEVSAALKNKRKIKARLITVITDFGVHPFWISGGTDLYVAASGITGKLLEKEGVSREKIRCSGIPVNPLFMRSYDRGTLLAKFGLREGRFTVLIVTGSFGIGPIEEIMSSLCGHAQVIIVCARNRKLYERLKNKASPGCLVMGFVDNMHELMAVSDIIITKPGGMSIAESLAMKLVPVFMSPIPGQETENVKILAGEGIGFYPSDTAGIRNVVLQLKDNPAMLAGIRKKMAGLSNPDANKDISDAIR